VKSRHITFAVRIRHAQLKYSDLDRCHLLKCRILAVFISAPEDGEAIWLAEFPIARACDLTSAPPLQRRV